jgi:hypothetical protein
MAAESPFERKRDRDDHPNGEWSERRLHPDRTRSSAATVGVVRQTIFRRKHRLAACNLIVLIGRRADRERKKTAALGHAMNSAHQIRRGTLSLSPRARMALVCDEVGGPTSDRENAHCVHCLPVPGRPIFFP